MPSNVLVACVGEDTPAHRMKTTHLVRTLRALGGRLADAPFTACFVERVSDETRGQLRDLGADVRVVERVDARYPHANKLRLFEIEGDHDVLVGLDIDVAVAGDFSDQVSEDSVAAKVVDGSRLSPRAWRELYAFAGLPLPAVRLVTTTTFAPVPPYFNSGVLLVPRRHQAPLVAAWRGWVQRLLGGYDRMPLVAPHWFFTDQYALSLALAETGIPWRPLPVEMNFPTHEAVHAEFEPDTCEPRLFHYHGEHDEAGLLRPPRYAGPARAVERINAVLRSAADTRPAAAAAATAGASTAGDTFDNRTFWDRRYRTNPALGSGCGSRGVHVLYKRALIEEVRDAVGAASVLDVGCGDIAVTRAVDLPAYTGIDVAPTAVARNREIRPDRRFIAGDFVEFAERERLSADLVLCLDVLIHQHDPVQYRRMVERLVRATRKAGLVAAYQVEPTGGFRSDITAWHEPIVGSLRRAGARDVEIVGWYRGTAVARWRAPRP